MADTVVLVIHGGERFEVEESYQVISSWFNSTASRVEARQFKLFGDDRSITISSAHLVAVIGEQPDAG